MKKKKKKLQPCKSKKERERGYWVAPDLRRKRTVLKRCKTWAHAGDKKLGKKNFKSG